MSDHFFNIEVAQLAGVPQALFISHLKFWTIINISNQKHLIDDLYWSYYTYEALQVIFPYYSKRQLEGIIDKCIELGLVVKGKHNKSKWDRTNWYALTLESYKFFPDIQKSIEKISILTNSPNGEIDPTKDVACSLHEMGKSTNTDTNHTDKPTTNTGDSAVSVSRAEIIIGIDADELIWQENLGKPCETTDKIEFLKWCKYWMAYECKVQDEAGKLRVLLSIIRKGGLAKPKGYTDDFESSPGKPMDNDKYDFQTYLSTVPRGILLKILPENFIPMNFQEWITANKPARAEPSHIKFIPLFTKDTNYEQI